MPSHSVVAVQATSPHRLPFHLLLTLALIQLHLQRAASHLSQRCIQQQSRKLALVSTAAQTLLTRDLFYHSRLGELELLFQTLARINAPIVHPPFSPILQHPAKIEASRPTLTF